MNRSLPLLSLLLVALGGCAGASNANVEAGKRVFVRCASCHAIDAKSGARIGPTLLGVVGRRAGSLPGYAYSPAMKSQTFAWDDQRLDRWLTDPAAMVPGTSMGFAGLANPEERKAVIAYMKQPK